MENAMVDARHEGGAYRRIEVITERRRRQNWTDGEKARIVAESFQPDVNISEVARRNGVSRGLLNVWRRQARAISTAPTTGMFAAVRLESEPGVKVETVVAAGKSKATVTAVRDVKRLRKPQSFVSKYEKAERRLDVVEFLHIAKAIGFDPSAVLAELGER